MLVWLHQYSIIKERYWHEKSRNIAAGNLARLEQMITSAVKT
jgi:hypothetical protein